MNYILRQGDSGQQVRRLNHRLGLDSSDFNENTKGRLRIEQQLRGLTPDGIAGPLTLDAMGMRMRRGIDISYWNGCVDWDEVAKAGIDFVYIKVTQGVDHLNGYRTRNFVEARKRGYDVGAYHFGSPHINTRGGGPVKDAGREAGHFADEIMKMERESGVRFTLMPAIDLEKGATDNALHNLIWLDRFIDWTANMLGLDHDRIPIYTAKWVWDLYLEGDFEAKAMLEDLAKNPLWWARYIRHRKDSRVEPRGTLEHWTSWDVWQWGKPFLDGCDSRKAFPGTCGIVDQNYMTSEAFAKLFIGEDKLAELCKCCGHEVTSD